MDRFKGKSKPETIHFPGKHGIFLSNVPLIQSSCFNHHLARFPMAFPMVSCRFPMGYPILSPSKKPGPAPPDLERRWMATPGRFMKPAERTVWPQTKEPISTTKSSSSGRGGGGVSVAWESPEKGWDEWGRMVKYTPYTVAYISVCVRMCIYIYI